jgi:hypothetical protein
MKTKIEADELSKIIPFPTFEKLRIDLDAGTMRKLRAESRATGSSVNQIVDEIVQLIIPAHHAEIEIGTALIDYTKELIGDSDDPATGIAAVSWREHIQNRVHRLQAEKSAMDRKSHKKRA